MPKILYVCLYLLDICIVACSIWNIRKKQGNMEKSIRFVLIFGLATTALYTVTIISDTYLVMSAFYSIMFICFDWLCYWLLTFTYYFTKYPKYSQILKIVWCFILFCDCITQLLNPFTEFSNTYQVIHTEDAVYLSIQSHWPYYTHLFLCYIMISTIMHLILYCARRQPKIYRYKYILIGASLFIVIIINAVFVFTNTYIDLSILTYGLLAVFFCYLVFQYQPKAFFTQVKSHFFEVEDAAVIIFNNEEKLLVCNQNAEQLFFSGDNRYEEDSLYIEQFLQQWKLNNLIALSSDYYCEGRICIDQKNRYFNIDYRKLFDEKKRYLGSYLIFHETTEKKHLVNYNRLTDIYNRNYFCNEVDRRLKDNEAEGFVLVVFDIQNFKGINEVIGIKSADEVLKCIARILSEHRPKDAIFGHASIDQFMLFVRECDLNIEELEREFINRCHEAGFFFGNRLYFGICQMNKTDLSAAKMYDCAIIALKAAKAGKIENKKYYTPQMSQNMLDQQFVINEMDEALQKGQFEVFLQPQVSAATEKITGAEALVRWNHPQKGYISPGVFIPVFEDNGFISKLDEYVWEKACQYLQHWKKQGGCWAERSISVNISRVDLFCLNVCEIFEHLITTYDIPKNLLRLEITESAYTQDEGMIMLVIQKLQSLGFTIEMDDFGSGYSSLNSLMDAPVDSLKLDMKFLQGNDPKKHSRIIIQSIAEMATKIGLKVVAEGVETEEQLSFLRSVGCETIQGFYYAKPMSVELFETRFQNAFMPEVV